jgi:hypothetical protein
VRKEIQVDRGDVRNGVTQVSTKRQSLEEDFRKNHSRSDIQIHAALHSSNDGSETSEVKKGRGSDGRSICGRMHVNDIGAHSDMNGDRDAEPCTGGKNADRVVGKLSSRLVHVTPNSLAKPMAVLRAARDGFIEHAPCFFRHTKASFVNFSVHLFRGVTHEGQFEVMNDSRSIHGHGRDDASLH